MGSRPRGWPRRSLPIHGGPARWGAGTAAAPQDEIDRNWERLLDGGQESQCGWLQDRYGLSSQVIPAGMEGLFADPDPQRAQRAMQPMLGIRKLDLAALLAAADGVAVS